MKQAQVDAWFEEGPSDNPDIRLLDEIILADKFHACFDCGWLRGRPSWEVWSTVTESEILEDGNCPSSPYTLCWLLCDKHVDNYRVTDSLTVIIRPVTRITAVVTEEDPA